MIAILERFKEPSSWSGIAALLTGLGIQLPDGVAENAAYVLAGIAGLLAVLLKEKAVK
jgi:hypothetical protein